MLQPGWRSHERATYNTLSIQGSLEECAPLDILDFLIIHRHSSTKNSVAQVGNARVSKSTFTKVGEELVLLEHRENGLKMFKVYFPQ